MTTLAQTILETDVESLPFSDLESLIFRITQDALRAPWDGNHVFLPHGSLAQVVAADSKSFAERFVLDIDVALSAKSMIGDEESLRIATRMLQLPSEKVWIECPTIGQVGTWGVYLREIRGVIQCSFILWSQKHGFSRPIDINITKELYAEQNIANVKKNDYRRGDLFQILVNTIAVLSIINHPRAVMRTVQQFPDKLQKRRAQRGKLPLLSFNTVRLNLPKEDITSRGTHVQRGSGVRWHRIIGYWRISRHGDPEAYFIWVPPGERGDKRLGIVLKERHARVRGGGRTSPEALHAA